MIVLLMAQIINIIYLYILNKIIPFKFSYVNYCQGIIAVNAEKLTREDDTGGTYIHNTMYQYYHLFIII